MICDRKRSNRTSRNFGKFYDPAFPPITLFVRRILFLCIGSHNSLTPPFKCDVLYENCLIIKQHEKNSDRQTKIVTGGRWAGVWKYQKQRDVIFECCPAENLKIKAKLRELWQKKKKKKFKLLPRSISEIFAVLVRLRPITTSGIRRFKKFLQIRPCLIKNRKKYLTSLMDQPPSNE